MKLKNLILGVAAAALMGGSAHATVTLYVVGSTAYRPAATAAILAYLYANTTGGVVNASTNATSGSTANILKASRAIYENSNASIIVETNWTGSAAGLVDLVTANATGDFFLDPSMTTPTQLVIPGLTGASNATAEYGTLNASALKTFVPNLTFSDSFNTSVASAVSTATLSASVGGASNAAQLAALVQGSNVSPAGDSNGPDGTDAVGIIPFAWYAGNSSVTNAALTNVTQETAAALIAGPTPLSLFTGNSADSGSNVFLIGRNEDSGTRIAAFAEAQQGFGGAPDQFELAFSNSQQTGTLTLASGNTTIPTGGASASGQATVIASGSKDFEKDAYLYTETKITWDLTGHSGYAGGGDVANVLLALNPGNLTIDGDPKALFIGYLGWADGYGLTNPSAGTSNGYPLAYNGVTAGVPAIQNGSYTYWGYEHCYYLTSGSNAIGSNQSVADGIADDVFNTYGTTFTPSQMAAITNLSAASLTAPPPAGILFNSVNVQRSQEGAPVVTGQL
jgi:hypothetical protein